MYRSLDGQDYARITQDYTGLRRITPGLRSAGLYIALTSRTQSENHTTRTASHASRISKGEVSFILFVRMRETYAWEIIFDI
jgi:hypothetical protein